MTEVSTLPVQRRLGRGLTALLGGNGPAHEELHREVPSDLREIPTHLISRNPFQPRQHFDPEALGELASSIREHGVLQPVIVRALNQGFQLIAGERRWQAAQKAGLSTIPCRVVDVIDKTACEFALEENLKRKDLNDLEKAQAFKDYIAQFECTIEELGKQLSMNRSTISNMLRLLDLPQPVKNALHTGRISAGHARAMLSLAEDQQLELSSRIQAEQLSVRATEAIVKTLLGRDTPSPAEASATPASSGVDNGASAVTSTGEVAIDRSSPHADSQEPLPAAVAPMTDEAGTVVPAAIDQHGADEFDASDAAPATIPLAEGEAHRTAHVASLEAQLRDMLGAAVEIKLNGRDSGQIIVSFSSNEEFERLLRTLRRQAA